MKKRGQAYIRRKCDYPGCTVVVSVLTENGAEYVETFERWEREGVCCSEHRKQHAQAKQNVDGGGI